MGIVSTLLEVGDTIFTIIAAVVLALIIVVLALNIKIVPQATAHVIECLGKYKKTWHTGIHFLIPFFEKISKRINLMEQVVDYPPQPVITRDNVRMQIDTVVFYQVTDCKLYTYGVSKPLLAIENLTATTLRNIIGELDLDETLTSRDIINTKLRVILDDATDAWGIKVNRVELKNIVPPKEIQEAMEKQMKAERERRAIILAAEGQKTSTILVAEGEKQRKILEAEAERAAKIEEAEGEAEAILKIQAATAQGIKMINESAPTEAVLTIKSLEAFEKAADGQATKIIIPSNIQGIAGLANALTESVVAPK